MPDRVRRRTLCNIALRSTNGFFRMSSPLSISRSNTQAVARPSLERLENDHMIATQTDTGQTLITVCKYNDAGQLQGNANDYTKGHTKETPRIQRRKRE